MATLSDIDLGTSPNDGTGTPLRSGGQIINNNFSELNLSKVEKYESASDPTVNDDGNNSSGNGIFAVSTVWVNTSTDFAFILTDNSTGAAVWEVITETSRGGFIDYNDSSTQTTPVSLVADTWTDIPNDGLGAFTNKLYSPDGVSEVLDTSTGYLDFTDLGLGSEILVRNDFTVTPQTNNALLEARYLLGTGAGEYALQFWSERLDSGSGIPYQRVTSFPIYMGDTNTRDNAGKMRLRLSTSGTVVNSGVYVSIRAKR